MLDTIKGFHIEPTNVCTLKCPRCARTNFIETFKNKNWDNYNLNLDDLKIFLDIDITGLRINLNGNYGDPIYYPQIFELIQYIKQNNASVTIHTNGSYKTSEWWEVLGSLLDKSDIVNFSIDGMPDNFTKYRINADWISIKQGIDTMVKSPAQIIWKYIIFSYNENDMEAAMQLSQELGMDDFVVNNSDRWIDNDWLRPTKHINITDTILYNASFNGVRSNEISKWKNNIKDITIDPVCKKTNSMHFISADGYYLPCCWTGDYRFYYQSEFYKNKEQYKISNTTISKILTTTKFYDTLDTQPPKYCTFNCPQISESLKVE